MDTIDAKALALAIKQIAEEKNLPEDLVQEILEQAIAAAYRRDFGERDQEVRTNVNLSTGVIDVYVGKTVVEEVQDPNLEMSLADAQRLKRDASIGDVIELHDQPQTFGRVAAQTAKQVIIQRLREAERDIIMEEYEDKIGTVLNATVARIEGRL